MLYPIDPASASDRTTQVTRALRLAGPSAVVLLADLPPEAYARPDSRTRRSARTAVDLELVSPPVARGERGGGGVRRCARRAWIPAAVRAAPEPVFRELPGAPGDGRAQGLRAPHAHRARTPWASSRAAIRRSSDEYLVFSAHMDHIGITPGLPDSVNNGADDDGSGTAGVMELAEAFSRPGARPKRSIIFLTVSGEEKGLWGSRYFSEHPPVPIDQIVADLNIDMIGRNWRTRSWRSGRSTRTSARRSTRVNRAHPELRMTAIDDRWPEERFYFRSDHYNFARKGVPILFFFNGVHPDYHQPSDSPDKIDAEKESRILRLLYYLGREVGEAPARPKWNPESYQEIVDERLGSLTPRRRAILRAMTDTIADFNAFRSRMNDLILGARQPHHQPILRARQPDLRGRRAGRQDEGDARAGLVARAPLRRLRDLSRHPLPRGRRHARGVPGDLLGRAGGGREHRDPASAAGRLARLEELEAQ